MADARHGNAKTTTSWSIGEPTFPILQPRTDRLSESTAFSQAGFPFGFRSIGHRQPLAESSPNRPQCETATIRTGILVGNSWTRRINRFTIKEPERQMNRPL